MTKILYDVGIRKSGCLLRIEGWGVGLAGKWHEGNMWGEGIILHLVERIGMF